MKLRQRPEDFLVRERLDPAVSPSGPFGLYRLAKQGVTTAAAVSEIARRTRLRPEQVGIGGLKDAHAETVQHLTLPGPPRPAMQGHGWTLEPVGRVAEALAPGQTGGNAFRIVVRDLSKKEAEDALARVPDTAAGGVPNYFDSQRFGSIAGGKGFPAKSLLAGRYEEGLKAVLTTTYRGQNRRDQALRQQVAQGWGDWKGLAGSLPHGEARAVAMYLRDHPGAFSGSLRCLAPNTRWLLLAAYQSHLFNEILAAHLRRRFPGGPDVSIRSGKLSFPPFEKKEAGALASERWPLPRKGAVMPPGIMEDVDAVLKAEGLTMDALQVKAARLTFPKGERAPWVMPEGLEASLIEEDELNRGRFAVTLAFALPPGSYATIVVKRLTYDAGHTFRA